jgi:hypothetical protein
MSVSKFLTDVSSSLIGCSFVDIFITWWGSDRIIWDLGNKKPKAGVSQYHSSYMITDLKNLLTDTLKQLRPIGKGEQVLEKRLDQKELT